MTALSCPPTAGVSLKPEHYRAALEAPADGLWFEIHPENYMGEGGPRLAWLDAIRARHPVSFHGVGLSLGGPDPLDEDHLARWRALTDRFEPVRVSEHLAWSRLGATHFHDLLPTPMTRAALDRFCEHVERMQEALGRPILVENPSRYIAMREEIPETDFLAETVRRTGCGLLLDINNVEVSAFNLGLDPAPWLDAIDPLIVGEIHVAGHAVKDDGDGGRIAIDDHGSSVRDSCWALLARFLRRAGPRPVLVEWDSDVPDFAVLMAEAAKADDLLEPVDA